MGISGIIFNSKLHYQHHLVLETKIEVTITPSTKESTNQSLEVSLWFLSFHNFLINNNSNYCWICYNQLILIIWSFADLCTRRFKIQRMFDYDIVHYQSDSKFIANENHKNHLVSIHEGVKYQCKQCASKFTTKRNLKVHEMSVH